MHSIKDVAARYNVQQQTVLAWIKSGELKAINVSPSVTAKIPRWRVSDDALAQFESIRATQPPAPKPKRKRFSEVDVNKWV